MLAEDDLIIEVGYVTLIKDSDGSLIGFCAINFIYFTVPCYLTIFFRLVVDPFVFYELFTDEVRLIVVFGCYCFFIFEGG